MRAGAWFWCGMMAAWFGAAGLIAVQPAGGAQKRLPVPRRGSGDSPGVEFFETRVRPILFHHCFSCHGEAKRTSGLRLDTLTGLLKGGSRGPAMVPGEPDKSLFLQAIRQEGALKMPPGGRLKPEQVQSLVAWVKMGAPWPGANGAARSGLPGRTSEAQKRHWAFLPVRKRTLPPVTNRSWARTPIDRFILAALEGKGLAPAPPADRRTLIRRATFDLTGLPPTPEEVEAFLNDPAPDAFAKVIDRLLASPRYGERWGRHWLDLARYADTKGYLFTEERRYPFAFTYRDWVIRAFNEDLPYDQFIIQQLAADRLPLGEDKRPLAAMGFLTVGRRFLNNIHDIIDDRIDVVSRGLMGLTVTCARCHDHKYDPIPSRDYYSLYGVFASSTEPQELPLIGTPAQNEAFLSYQKELGEKQARIAAFLETKKAELLAEARDKVTDYLLAVFAVQRGKDQDELRDIAPDRATLPILVPALLRQWQRFLDETGKRRDEIFAPWNTFAALTEAEFAAQAPGVAAKVAANDNPAAPINPLVAQAFSGPPPASIKEVARRYGVLFASVGALWQQAISANPQTTALPDPHREALRQVLYSESGPISIPAEQLERAFDIGVRNQLRALRGEVTRLQATHPGAPERAMVLIDAPAPHNPRVFLRGNPDNPGDEVPRQFPLVLAGEGRRPFTDGSGRLELARAIASKENPLTARVIVNRIWMHHFGDGLVRTPSDFGTRSEPPTNPALLDYLAWRFMNDGWSIKRLHRLIMLSAVYQQSSHPDPRSTRIDPENRLLSRMNRRPLELEALRDSLLAVAGRLDLTLGGPSVEITTQPFSTRRTVYAFVERQNLQGLFRTFNLASPDAHTPKRHQTTIPQQALFLMNGPFAVEQARHLARRPDVRQRKTLAERIQRLYRLAYGRPATPGEVQLSLQFLKATRVSDPGWRAASAWRQGYGAFDEPTGRVTRFTPLPHWTGEVWQGGAEFPDSQLGFLRLTATGGHVGNDLQHAAIRRWVAPFDGVVSITGVIGHPSDQGDGVRARIVSGRSGPLGTWMVQKGQAEAVVQRAEVRRGDTIDFVVDCRDNPNSDSFTWAPVIRVVSRLDGAATGAAEWNANADFTGPAQEPLTVWEEYVQVLLLANEFLFVD